MDWAFNALNIQLFLSFHKTQMQQSQTSCKKERRDLKPPEE